MLQNVPFQGFGLKILSNYSLPAMTQPLVCSAVSVIKLFSLTLMQCKNKLECLSGECLLMRIFHTLKSLAVTNFIMKNFIDFIISETYTMKIWPLKFLEGQRL
jgi:hypothetical protein